MGNIGEIVTVQELNLPDSTGTRAIFDRAILSMVLESNEPVWLRELQTKGMEACEKLEHPIKQITASSYCRELIKAGYLKSRRSKSKYYISLVNGRFEEIDDLLETDWGTTYILWRDSKYDEMNPVVQDLMDRVPFRMTTNSRLSREQWQAVMAMFNRGDIDLRVVAPRG